MEDIPQPTKESYSVGNRVRIYIGTSDSDSHHHDKVCEIVEVLADDLGIETGRTTDTYSYILRDIDTNKELSISFRHRDLVPAEDDL